MKQKFQILVLTLALLQTGTLVINAANVTIIPGSIDNALISAVSDGDTLTLQPGTYTYNSNVPTVGLSIDKNITIQSSDSSQNAIIDLNGFSRAFNVASDGNLTLINITIINGYSRSDGGAISNNGNVTLFGCTFMNNSADNSGGAIDNYCGNLNLIDCIFIGNTAQLSGGAVSNRGLVPTIIAYLTAESCIFLNNRTPMGNTIYNVNNANLSVSFSVFYNNTDLGILNYNDGLSGAFKDNFYFWNNPDLNNPTDMATLLESICRNHNVVQGFYYLNFTTNTVSCIGDTLNINSLSYTGSVDNRNSLPDLNIVLNYNGDTVAYYNYKNETKIELDSLVNDFSFYYEGSLLYQMSINVTAASPTISGSNTLSGTAGYFGDLTATATITNGWFRGSTPGMALVATITDGTHTATATATATAASVDFVFPAAQLNTLVVGGPYDIIVSAFAGNDNNNGFAAQKIGELTVRAKATPAVNLTATAGATFNDDITLTATVSPAENGATPTGTITFVQGDTTLATLSLDDLGTSTYVVPSPFDAGSYTYTATYSGDDNYNAGSATATLDVPTGIFLSTNSLNFIAAGETKAITVMSNTAWSLASDAGWATITSANDDSYTMFVTAKSNPAAAQRSMLFTFRAGADVKTLRVTQDGLDATAIPSADAPQVIVYSQDGKVVVKADAPIKSVIVYDVTGKVLKVLKVPNEVNRLITISGLPKQQMLIVKVTSDERQTANYKLIIH